MSEWYQRQFGDRGTFAVVVSLGADPHPSGILARDAAWGSLEMWARGHCLTESVAEGGGVNQGVRWTLLPVLEWLLDVGIRLVNEDPYPRFSKSRDVSDGTPWYDATLSPPVLTEEAERRWFLRRSEWRHHHALRRAAEDVALPNVVFRRMGHDVEISWDNDAWAPPRRDVRFVERRGRELVGASTFESVVRGVLVEVLSTLVERSGDVHLGGLAERARTSRAASEDWRWLIHRPTAELIRREMPELRARLDAAAEKDAVGLYVPHSAVTFVLRHVRLERPTDVEAVLHAAELLPHRPLATALHDLVRPLPASNRYPWDEGNEYAEMVREALGWGTDPLPDLAPWLAAQGIRVPAGDLGLPEAIAVLTGRAEDMRAMVHVNPRASTSRKETGLATALGHVLLDDGPVSIDGEWEHSPTAARARAFGVALMLPEEGVRGLLSETATVGREEVRAIMKRYRTGPLATTFRLKNLGLITPEEQAELASTP